MIAAQTTRQRCRSALGAWLRGRRHQIEQTPASWALLAPTAVRVAEIEAVAEEMHGAIKVMIDPHFTPGECTWCAPARPELATVRVCGDPDPEQDHMKPLFAAEVCHRCAVNPRTGAVRQALIEAGPHRLVEVEVCES
ncbi:hypothetical protein [Amycolatopsis echigonensis]|uniref:Uncharacterized protein n=1 Tax=Amycolatopsis echigonensis TaxID=2576905 RepID=A0A8E2BA13_9PSEU|nr:hypothetical protein [Amycolatopsis echigonensis]MBB2505997.1 hypothetical protein [Amycolatopsis echigonensis]